MTDHEPGVRIIAQFPSLSAEQFQAVQTALGRLGALSIQIEPISDSEIDLLGAIAELPVSEEDRIMAGRLRRPAGVALERGNEKNASLTRLQNVLVREGLDTVGDVLLAGQRRVRDFRLVNDKSIQMLGQMLQAELEPGIVWPEELDIEHYARLSPSIEYVSAALIDYRLRGWTIGEILRIPARDRAEWVGGMRGTDDWLRPMRAVDPVTFWGLYREVEVFAARFLRARRAQLGRSDEIW